MKKRLLSAFMALALCLTLLPTAARAEETAGNVAEVPAGSKTTRYTNIVDAFAAAQKAESAAVKLLTDVLLVCWRESAGARLERAYAEKIGKDIVVAEQGWIEEYLERAETVPGIE